MVKGALFKKSIRDIKESLSQFISIFLMATIAISILVGLDSMGATMDTHSKEMYQSTHLSDIWVSIINPTEKDMWKLGSTRGIEKAEKRFTTNVLTNLQDKPTLKLYTTSEKSTLDIPYITQGTVAGIGGAVLDESFAKAHNLQIGDSISIEINDRWMDFEIDALALSSEHIFSIKDATTLQPNPEKYGFIIVNEEKIKEAYGGKKIYNQIAVKFTENVDEKQVMKKIDAALGKSLIGITTKKDSRSVGDVNGRIEQFKTLATVFPNMFFLVTALITLSTMSRLVEDQRNQIGTLKALGYSKRSIVWHYTSYGVYVGLLGALAGIVVGPNLIGKTLITQMQSLYVMHSYKIMLNMPRAIIGTLLIVACTAGVACYSCLKMQGEMPAVLLRNKQPKKGNHIFLERLPFIWNKMKFSHKLIARNTIRNKGRMLMSIFGVMGCTGLILGALTLDDTVRGIGKTMYGETYTYDHTAILDTKTTDKDIYNLHIKGVTQSMEETGMQVVAKNGERRMVRVTVLTKESPLVHLQDGEGRPVTVPDGGATITRKLAEVLGVSKGQTIQIKRIDESYEELEIKQIVHMVSGQGIYITKAFWESLGEVYQPTSLLIKWQSKDISLLDSDYIQTYVSVETQREGFEGNLSIIFIATIMLITFGGVLAFVVLYNLSILNFFERIRDLATLKVLGFYKQEIRALVFVENIVSATLGIFAGIPLGGAVANIIIKGFGENLDLVSKLTRNNILMAGGITFIFVIIVNVIVEQKIKTIDMLQALKSVE